MKKHHWIFIALGVVCFLVFTLNAVPTADDDELADYIRETVTVKFALSPGAITVDIDERNVRLDGVVISEEQRRQIIETVRPLVGARTLLPTQRLKRRSNLNSRASPRLWAQYGYPSRQPGP